MKLASLKQHRNQRAHDRDGQLVVVSRDLKRCISATGIAPTLQAALDDWDNCRPELEQLSELLNNASLARQQPFEPQDCLAPLPRAYHWADGSAYLNHVALVRKARGAELPSSFDTDPLIYQGGSDRLSGPREPIIAAEAWGIDFEAEVVVITTDIPLGAKRQRCRDAIALITLVNDVSLRYLIPPELAKGFGFYQSKPASAFAPVAVTPDELAPHWRDDKVHLPLRVWLNDQPFGFPNAGQDMNFNFSELLHHCAVTRELGAGTLLGSGTVSNAQDGLWGSSIANGGVGYCCLAELRMYETIEQGQPSTPFMKDGDRVRIEMFDETNRSIFGAIDQRVQTLKT
jgi:fumarylacetoacetate (FAA) hydrolase